jgi:hypothetical protein
MLLTTPRREHTLSVGQVLIGRAPTCQVVISDPLVSREHALIRIGLDDAFVEDLASANGVYVNNVRIFEPYQLCDGDRILVGTQELCAFALSSRKRRALPAPDPCVEPAEDPLPPTKRLDTAAVLARAARQMLDLGAPGEAERILDDHLRKILAAACDQRALPPAVCTDAARLAAALATTLGNGRWFDYAVELHYRARLPMSIEIATALAEAAGVVTEVDHVVLARYVIWLDAHRDPMKPEQAGVLCLLESLDRGEP